MGLFTRGSSTPDRSFLPDIFVQNGTCRDVKRHAKRRRGVNQGAWMF